MGDHLIPPLHVHKAEGESTAAGGLHRGAAVLSPSLSSACAWRMKTHGMSPDRSFFMEVHQWRDGKVVGVLGEEQIGQVFPHPQIS